MVRRPGRLPAGGVSNGIQSHEDLFVTLAAAGEADIKKKLLDGYEMGGTTYKAHLNANGDAGHSQRMGIDYRSCLER